MRKQKTIIITLIKLYLMSQNRNHEGVRYSAFNYYLVRIYWDVCSEGHSD